MKMRKILSFVLVLSLVLGSFSMAFAATPSTGLSDIAGIANEDAIQVNNDLGIIKGFPDGTFKPEQMVNRAEFAAMITRALAVPESALAGYTSTTFKDTAGYGWAVPYLAFAQAKGIMIGDGQGNVMPGRTINMNEAVTMVLRALGYVNHSAELVGSWPSNYVTVAQNVGLYDDVAATLTVDRANAAQIIYNALTVQKVSVNADGETKYLTTTGTTDPAVLLNTGLGCTAVANMTLGKPVYSYGDTAFNITNRLGQVGTAYVKDFGKSSAEVMAFTVDSVALTGSMEDGKFEANGVKYTLGTGVTSSATYVAIVNGHYYPAFDATASQAGITTSSITDIAAFASHDVTINAKVSGKTITELYNIVGWKANAPGKISSSDLSVLKNTDKLFGESFVKDTDDEIDTMQFAIIGADAVTDIAKDDIVYVYSDLTSSGNEVRKVAVGTEVITGEITAVGFDYVTVAGKNYKASKVSQSDGLPTTASLGEDATLYLDAYGKIYKFEAATTSADKFGVALAYQPENVSAFQKEQIRVFNVDEKKVNLGFDTDAKWVAKASGFVTTENAFVSKIVTDSAAMLVGYALNADGEVKTLDITATYGATMTLKAGALENYTLADDVTVFTYDTTLAAITTVPAVSGTFENIAIDNVKLGTIKNVYYVLNDDSEVVAMMIPSTTGTKSGTDAYAVYTSYNTTKIGDDMVVNLFGFVDGSAVTQQTNTTYGTKFKPATTVDLYRVTFDGAGLVKEAKSMNAITSPLTDSHVMTKGAIIAYAGIEKDGTLITVGTDKYAIESDAVVYEVKYKANSNDIDTYVPSTLSSLADGYTVWLYDTKGTDADGTATVVIFKAN